MGSKYVTRVVTVAASVAAVLGGGTFALASDSAASASTTGTVYSACVTRLGHALYDVTANGTPKCLKGDTLITWNQAGPQGPAGTFGSVHTFSVSGDVPNNNAGTVIAGCDTGTATGGGGSWGSALVNVFLNESRPVPETGSPSGWEVTVANTSGNTISLKVDVLCATAAGSNSSAASQAQGARIIKKTLTPLPKAANS
jgi:hypothetical protein